MRELRRAKWICVVTMLAAGLVANGCATDEVEPIQEEQIEGNNDTSTNNENQDQNNDQQLEAPVIEAFEATPSEPDFGDTVTLSWTLSGGEPTELTLEPAAGDDTESDDVLGQASVEVTVDASVTYTLTATNAEGTDTATVSLTPVGGAPAIASFDAQPNPVVAGQELVFGWDLQSFASDIVSCEIDVDDDGTPEYELDDCLGTTEQAHTYAAEGSYTARLSATGQGGDVTHTVVVDVDKAPVVVRNTDDDGPESLRGAVRTVESGGRIEFDLGGQAIIGLNSQILIDKNITICGEGRDLTILDGKMSSSIFQIEGDVTVTICDLTMQNGLSETEPLSSEPNAFNSAEEGGLVQAEGDAVQLILRNVVAKDATTYREDPDRTFDNGGCVYLRTGTLHVESSLFSNCFASSGGAISAFGEVTITDSTFELSESMNPGGALQIIGTLDLRGSTFVDNVAGTGGGAFIVEGRPETHKGPRGDGTSLVVNSTFSGNQTPNGGGAIMAFADMFVINSTFVENSAYDASELDGDNGVTYGGGIYVNSSGSLVLRNSILWNNESPQGADIKGEFSAEGANIITTLDGATPSDTSGILDTDPKLGALADNGGPTETFAPGAGSSALDAVPQGECVDVGGGTLSIDQRGEPRPDNELCEVGAVEEQTGN